MGLLETIADALEPIRSKSYYTRKEARERRGEVENQIEGIMGMPAQDYSNPFQERGRDMYTQPGTGLRGVLSDDDATLPQWRTAVGDAAAQMMAIPEYQQQATALMNNVTSNWQTAANQQDELNWYKDNMTAYQQGQLKVAQGQLDISRMQLDENIKNNRRAAIEGYQTKWNDEMAGFEGSIQNAQLIDEVMMTHDGDYNKATGTERLTTAIRMISSSKPNVEALNDQDMVELAKASGWHPGLGSLVGWIADVGVKDPVFLREMHQTLQKVAETNQRAIDDQVRKLREGVPWLTDQDEKTIRRSDRKRYERYVPPNNGGLPMPQGGVLTPPPNAVRAR